MTSERSAAALGLTRVRAIVEFLEGAGIEHELVEHEPVMSAAAEARAAHRPPHQVARRWCCMTAART